ncbi:MAG TPA: NAD-dependent epimerase/dehydratase family protein [Candidatus Nanoarchaeia archaeon]|nr:NAD-dependent epimerase/dehydratase family protein [Candidatus Nanoarchaeia archaeon]
MKILVTGGAGFIGSHVVDTLIRRGDTVVVVDNLSTGKESNINPNAEFYKLDINSGILEEIFKGGIDVVIHLAAQVSVTRSLENPSYDALVNINGSLNLINLAKKYGVDKFIYINSAAIFGDPQYLPIDENHPKNPKANYGLSKSVVEDYLRIAKINFVSLRLANVYGPRQTAQGEGGVIAIFSQAFANRKPIYIHGDGEQTRDFIFVKDVARAVICAIENGLGCFNIGTGKKITLNGLIKIIHAVCGYEVEKKKAPVRDGDIRESVLGISKARDILKWEAEISLEQGLLETIDYERNKT